MTTIEIQHIQSTIDYLRKCAADGHKLEARHKAAGNLDLENWFQGRANGFEDAARWLERDLKFFSQSIDAA